MATFEYIVTKKDGKSVEGSAEAVNKESLVSSLRKQGLTPLVVKKKGESSKVLSNFSVRKKVKVKDLAVFNRQLSTMVSAGVPLNKALGTLQDL